MGSRTGAAVKDFAYSECTRLPNNLGYEVDLVVGRSDAGSDLHYEIRWITAEFPAHGRNRFGDRAKLGAFLPGMNETDRVRFLVGQVDCRAIGNVDREAYSELTGQKAVGAWSGIGNGSIDPSDGVAVDLFGQGKLHVGEPERVCGRPVR